MRLIRHLPHWWWLAASAGWFVLLVLMSKITPAVIVPLFYKLHPLPDRDLADRLLALAGRCGVRVPASSRSASARRRTRPTPPSSDWATSGES